jgi:tetratricopeptide (TPR) repeat protein
VADKSSTLALNKVLKDAIFQYNRKNVKGSKKLFAKVITGDPKNPDANYYLGLIHAKDYEWKKAVTHLKAVVDLGASYLFTQQCRMILGYIYYNMKDYQKAEEEYLQVLKSKVNIVQVYSALACIKYNLNDEKAALNYAEKACDIDSYNMNAKNTYGFLLCDFDIDIPKGLELLKEVVRKKPYNPAYLDSLGWAYYKKGDKTLAVENLKLAVKMSRNNPEIVGHLEAVYRN